MCLDPNLSNRWHRGTALKIGMILQRSSAGWVARARKSAKTRSKVASDSKTLGIPPNFGFRSLQNIGCFCLRWHTAAIGFEQSVQQGQPNSS